MPGCRDGAAHGRSIKGNRVRTKFKKHTELMGEAPSHVEKISVLSWPQALSFMGIISVRRVILVHNFS